jgi:transposase-like protein
MLHAGPQRRWTVEESRIRIRGAWCRLHRAVDAVVETVDFWLGDRRDIAMADPYFVALCQQVSSRFANSEAVGGPRS